MLRRLLLVLVGLVYTGVHAHNPVLDTNLYTESDASESARSGESDIEIKHGAVRRTHIPRLPDAISTTFVSMDNSLGFTLFGCVGVASVLLGAMLARTHPRQVDEPKETLEDATEITSTTEIPML